ncbi:MAG: hypothetical protein ACLFUJ_12725 [Phycisphaerae bacterium]
MKPLRTILLLAVLLAGAVLTVWAQQRPEAPARPERHKPSERSERSRPGWQLSQEKIDELLEHIKSTRPDEYKQLMQLKQTQPRRFRWVLMEKYRWYRRYQSMPEVVQKALLAQYEARVGIARIRKALADEPTAQQLETLTKQLKAQVAALFDANQTIRAHYLEQLEQKLQRFRQEVKEREQNRDSLIDEQVQRILEDPDKDPSSRRHRDRRPRGQNKNDEEMPEPENE